MGVNLSPLYFFWIKNCCLLTWNLANILITKKNFQRSNKNFLNVTWHLKFVSATLYQIFIFHQMIALQKLRKMVFISSKKLFSFSRYSNFCMFLFPLFFPVSHCFIGWFKENLKVHDVINCLNKNLITHYAWYLKKKIRCDIETLSIDIVLNPEHFNGKIMQKMCTKS